MSIKIINIYSPMLPKVSIKFVPTTWSNFNNRFTFFSLLNCLFNVIFIYFIFGFIVYNITKCISYMFKNKIKILFTISINSSTINYTKYIGNNSINIFKKSKTTKITNFQATFVVVLYTHTLIIIIISKY